MIPHFAQGVQPKEAMLVFKAQSKIKRLFALAVGLLLAASFALPGSQTLSAENVAPAEPPCISIGYVTDIHHNDVGARAGCQVETLPAVIEHFNQLPLAFLVSGGDFLDRNTKDPLGELRKLEAVYQSGVHKGYHVLGNHDYDEPGGVNIAKAEFIANTSMEAEYYHRDYGHLRFLFLNANPDARGAEQFEWVERKILGTDRPVAVFAHHPISGEAGRIRPLREVLSRHGERVVAAFTAHRGRVTNTVDEIGGVLYYSMAHYHHQVPTYAVITIGGESGVEVSIQGFGRQASFEGARKIE